VAYYFIIFVIIQARPFHRILQIEAKKYNVPVPNTGVGLPVEKIKKQGVLCTTVLFCDDASRYYPELM
jgi:hypothetical protein